MPLSPRTLRPQASASAGVSFVNPTSLSGLVLWLDADDPATMYDATTGGSQVALEGTIARWQDKSGQNNHATQFQLNSRPLKKTAFINGKHAVHHDGADDCLELTYSLDASVFTALCVLKKTSATTSNYVFTLVQNTLGMGGALPYLFINALDFSNTTQSTSRRVSPAGYNSHIGQGFGYSELSTNPALLALRMNPGRFRANKTAYTTANSSNSTTCGSFDNLCGEVGLWSAWAAIGELVFYNRDLTDAEFTACENYLATKWGI
jgi:hypothetical protein